jgi:hypothetical protein
MNSEDCTPWPTCTLKCLLLGRFPPPVFSLVALDVVLRASKIDYRRGSARVGLIVERMSVFCIGDMLRQRSTSPLPSIAGFSTRYQGT